MFKVCNIYDNNIIFKPNYVFESSSLSDIEFEDLILELYGKRNFYHLYLLVYLNFSILGNYEFKNLRAHEILNNLNIIKIPGNFLFIDANIEDLFGIRINKYEDLEKLKITDVSELIIIKNYLRNELYKRNPSLLHPNSIDMRNSEEQRLSRIMFAYMDLQAIHNIDLDTADWFCRLFTIDNLILSIANFYDANFTKKFFNEYFTLLTHNKFYTEHSISQVLIKILKNKDYHVFSSVYSLFIGKIFNPVVFDIAFDSKIDEDIKEQLLLDFPILENEFQKKVKDIFIDITKDSQDLSVDEYLNVLDKFNAKDQLTKNIIEILKKEWKIIKKISSRYCS